jgi:hypothetical protein
LFVCTVHGCYGDKGTAGRIGLCCDGTAEFPLRSYGPSLGRAGDACATLTKPPKIVLLFINVSDTDTMNYVWSNASLRLNRSKFAGRILLENELSEVLRSLGSHNPRKVHSSRRV